MTTEANTAAALTIEHVRAVAPINPTPAPRSSSGVTHWTKTNTGWKLGAHSLDKSGKCWTLTLGSGQTFDLGRKASFDQAEGLIAEANR